MSKIQKITYQGFLSDVDTLIEQIKSNGNALKIYDNVYGVPRGGVPIALLVAKALNLPICPSPELADFHTLVVDDIIDSGATRAKFPDSDLAVLYRKPHAPATPYCVREYDTWIELPYENTVKDDEDVVRRLLEILGEDPTREGLVDTPKRVIKFYKEFLNPPEFKYTSFDSEGYDEMIIQKNIPFFSLCEHHMAPFFGHATVAYIPDKRIIGLSKLARTVETYSRKLQNQERITNQVAQKLVDELQPKGVAVILTARHFCMEMRGVKTHDVHTTTSKLVGAFHENPETRAELTNLLKQE